jgi:copper chaperone CopZ
MSSVHARRAVFTGLAGVPGVVRADVTLGRADVEHDDSVSESALRDAVAVAGYEVTDAAADRRTLPQRP